MLPKKQEHHLLTTVFGLIVVWRKENFQRQLAIDKGKTFEVLEMEEAIQDSMLDARKTLQKIRICE